MFIFKVIIYISTLVGIGLYYLIGSWVGMFACCVLGTLAGLLAEVQEMDDHPEQVAKPFKIQPPQK